MFVLILGTQGAVPLEHVTRHLLWYLALLGSLPSSIFFGMVVVATFRYVGASRKLRQESADAPDTFPSVSILKPVHGMEPRLEETLESFFRQDYPDFEIIF